MQPLRQIRRRIKSTENTKKMTRAMEMVAAAKLKKLQDLLRQSDRYIGELRRILETLVREKPLTHPLLEKRIVGAGSKPAPTLAFLIASDSGLCGSYNTNVLDRASRWLNEEGRPKEIRFISIGKHAANFLKRRKLTLQKELTIPRPQEIEAAIHEISQIATSEFTAKTADQVVFIHTKAASLGSLKPTVAQLFPIASTPYSSPLVGEGIPLSTSEDADYIIEPALAEILEAMVPEFVEAEIGQFVKHSLVAEQASRMMAMRQASDNAEEMIDSLTLLRNKARQASITKELIEVVSGSRALQIR